MPKSVIKTSENKTKGFVTGTSYHGTEMEILFCYKLHVLSK